MARTAATRIVVIAVISFGGAVLGGCQSHVTIASEPSEARVWVDGREHARTPVRVLVNWSPGRDNPVILEHPECYRFSTVLRRALHGWSALPPIPHQRFVLAPLPRKPGGAATRPGPDAEAPAPRPPELPQAQLDKEGNTGVVADVVGRQAYEAARARLLMFPEDYAGNVAALKQLLATAAGSEYEEAIAELLARQETLLERKR